MNLNNLTETEASYLLFAIKKALRDRPGLTPGMEQWFDNTYDALSDKLRRLHGQPQVKTRNRDAYVQASWAPESLARISEDLARDHGKESTDA